MMMMMMMMVFTDSPGVYDPCEREPTDLCTTMSLQEREGVTVSAQVSLLATHSVFSALCILSAYVLALIKSST